jgi:nucleotide-binding universal stress UspA family protein
MAEWTRICCGVDFSGCSHVALDEAAALAARTGATLTVLHVYPPPRPATISADMLAWTPPDLEAQALADLERPMEHLRAKAEAVVGKGRVEVRLLPGHPAEEIVRQAKEGRHDLVVIGTHGRTGVKRLVLGSVAEQVVRAAPVSVLVVRETLPATE